MSQRQTCASSSEGCRRPRVTFVIASRMDTLGKGFHVPTDDRHNAFTGACHHSGRREAHEAIPALKGSKFASRTPRKEVVRLVFEAWDGIFVPKRWDAVGKIPSIKACFAKPAGVFRCPTTSGMNDLLGHRWSGGRRHACASRV